MKHFDIVPGSRGRCKLTKRNFIVLEVESVHNVYRSKDGEKQPWCRIWVLYESNGWIMRIARDIERDVRWLDK